MIELFALIQHSLMVIIMLNITHAYKCMNILWLDIVTFIFYTYSKY